jgi:L-amino acid N-acyltransferase YncA
MSTHVNTPLLVAKFRRNARDYGIGVALKKSVKYLFAFIYERKRYRIYAIDLNRCERRPPKQDDFSYRLVQPENRDVIRQIEDMEEWLRERVASMLRKGSICIAAMDDGKVAGFNLVSFGDIYMIFVKKRRGFRRGEAWSEQITVNKAYRGKSLGSTLRLRMFDELRGKGIRKFYGGTMPDNEANLRLTRTVGFRELFDIEYRNILTMKSWKYRKIPRSPSGDL